MDQATQVGGNSVVFTVVLTAIATAIATLIPILVAAWVAYRKMKADDKKADKTTDREDEESAIKQWKAYATNLARANQATMEVVETRHRKEFDKLEEKNRQQDLEIAALFQKERECQIKNTRMEEQIKYLTEQIAELRDEKNQENDQASSSDTKLG